MSRRLETLAAEHTPLLQAQDRRLSHIQADEASSIAASHISQEERALGSSSVGERLPYNDYVCFLLHLLRFFPLTAA